MPVQFLRVAARPRLFTAAAAGTMPWLLSCAPALAAGRHS
jgi:hypothetical protein